MDSKQAAHPSSVLVLSQFHAPEPCAAANRVSALTRALAEVGFRVEVLTGFANFPDGVLAESDRKLVRSEQVTEQIRLVRIFTYASRKVSGRSRFLNWASVAVAMTIRILSSRSRFDLVVVTLPPITLALPALAALLRYRARLIVDIRDVFPDVAVKMGYWRKGSIIARIVGAVAALLYRASNLVLCVTAAARVEIISRGAEAAKVVLAYNGFDPIEIAPQAPFQLTSGQFLATFVGNMGLATSLDTIIDAAERLNDEKHIHFVLAGGGVDKDRVSRRICEKRLNNVTMLGIVTRPLANALLARSAVSLVTLHPGIIDSLPTKMFDALMVGCPVVCCANGEAREFIERSGGGVVVPANDGAALARALRDLYADPERRLACAEAGKRYVIAHYDRSEIMHGVAARLAQLVNH